MTDPIQQFKQEVKDNIGCLSKATELKKLGVQFVRESGPYKYSYNFNWMGMPVIQFPQDIMAMQELIWEVKPDLIIETGVARGGSLVMYAGLMKMMDLEGEVVGIDIDIRAHNRKAIENHPLANRIKLVQGSSIDPETVAKVKEFTKGKKRVLVCLDSMHTHDHVLEELKLYSPLVTKDSYLVVFDTSVEDMPANYFPDRPWGPGNNPFTAVHEFVKTTKDFVIDQTICDKLVITVARDGYLKRIA